MTIMPTLAILAGGLATRMRPMTETVPKSLLEVAGEPFIAHQLRLIRRQGISQVTLCVGYRWEMIQDFVGNGAGFGLQVTYSMDQPKLLGTGGALRKALPHLGSQFLVLYGDSWLDADWAPVVQAFHNSGKPAVLAVFRNQGQWDRSNAWYEKGKLYRYDKGTRLPQMRHIDWGLSMVSSAVIEAQPADTPFDLAELYTELSRRDELAGFEVSTRFYEIGSPAGLRETDALLRRVRSH